MNHELSELLALCGPLTEKEYKAQRKSWVVGQMMLTYPEMTREKAEAVYDQAVGTDGGA